eukprot:CAMPEP_0113556372 /NCGR_PEP_ID=MMETSP0015_2-20120614/17222_1 /TAXON_ID=2838 /ORGANISM="Odontella" /LENGTH=655 /DNA_ID=CAMNT_0000457725 /DNA_START=272 /DNA_END=2239 /DNA_ORIENTATION=- /assembly_acc=CAM_ASM_000160
MTSYKAIALAFLLGTLAERSFAFVQPSSPSSVENGKSLVGRLKPLHAFTPPTMIIGPMIKKMREENAKKKMPLASDEERGSEAPGLRVGGNAWKWPPVWPYDSDMFTRTEEIKAPAAASGMDAMANMMGGMAPVPNATAAVKDDDENKLDVLKYWSEEKAGVTTDLDPEAAEQLTSHYEFYLRDGMSVLEFGAAENSYLPEGLALSRLVGVGASTDMMDRNPALTEKLVVDLNDVVADNGIDSDDLRKLGSNTFDVIVMANTIDFLTNPREVFKSAWNLLKPGGLMMVPFMSKDAYVEKFERAQTKMWRDMNDDQHMWIAGSFFQFSAGDGWESLKGFDVSPEGAKIDDGGPLSGLMGQKKGKSIFVVQATKAYQDDAVDAEDPEKSFKSKMWMVPTLESRDKMLVAPRLARAYVADSTSGKDIWSGKIEHTLPKVYESLIKMDQFVFTFSMQAQLAADLATDPDFDANDEQIAALKMGLGLRTPSEEFWMPVGTQTANMDAEDKINLLAHVVPRFGSSDPDQEAALEAFVTALSPTFSVIRSKCPGLSEGEVQLIGSELLAGEVLRPGRSTREEFAIWLGELDESELTGYLKKRKSFKEVALADMKAMQDERAAEEAALEARRLKFREQVKKAREVRTLAFNPQNGKVEPVKKK